jgi:uncharacterized RDD family membrane protein YckC
MVVKSRTSERAMKARADEGDSAYWWRRAAAYTLRIILPWSFLAQVFGTVLVGRSWPMGPAGQLLGVMAFIVVVLASSLSAVNGQPWTYRILQLQMCGLTTQPASRMRIALREVAHLIDFLSLGLGFFWPLWDSKGQTFADKLAGTRIRRASSGEDH